MALKVLTCSQNKGGSGKTTVSRLVAEYAALAGHRVLCIDLDPQCSLSQRFLRMDKDPDQTNVFMPPIYPGFDPASPDPEEFDPEFSGRSSAADIYLGAPVYPYPTNHENLELLCGHGPDLMRVERVTQEDVSRLVHHCLRDFMVARNVGDHYDLVVIDTAPTLGPLTVSAVRAATHVIIPTTMEPQGVEGLQGMLTLWRDENARRARDEPIKLLGMVANKFRSRVALQEATLGNLRSDAVIGPMMIPHVLGLRAEIAEQDHDSVRPHGVFDLPASSKGRREAEALCRFVMEEMELAPMKEIAA